MSLVSLHTLTIRSLHEKLVRKECSALEIAQAYFARIKEKNGELNAYLSVAEDSAAREAEAADLAIARGEKIGMLAGVPFALKDNILIEGQPATAGSKLLKNYAACYDAGAVQNLKSAGAIFLGKTNLDEFAMGSSTENSAFGPVKNPRDTSRVPGGSSGGSAAAVAAHLALAALGSDTGGSIRQPAAFCGITGLKPTYGAVSRSGLISMASSLDQIGPLAGTVDDAALVFDAIRGHDPQDATSRDADYGKTLVASDLATVKKLRVGLPKEYFADGLDPLVREEITRAAERVRSLGLSVRDVSLPHTQYALSAYYIIMPAEVSANLARFDGIRYARTHHPKNLLDLYLRNRGEGFGAETKRRIILGTFVLSSGYYDAYYAKAQKVRTLIARDFEEAFKQVDVLLAPVTPTPPFKIGEKASDPLSMYLSDILTIPANLAGLPALALPVSRETKNLPVGFQLIGKPWREADILGIGRYYEELTPAPDGSRP